MTQNKYVYTKFQRLYYLERGIGDGNFKRCFVLKNIPTTQIDSCFGSRIFFKITIGVW